MALTGEIEFIDEQGVIRLHNERCPEYNGNYILSGIKSVNNTQANIFLKDMPVSCGYVYATDYDKERKIYHDENLRFVTCNLQEDRLSYFLISNKIATQ